MQSHERLEDEFGKWAKVSNVVACSSGTAALHLALEALQLTPGSKVLVPDYTMVACPRAVRMAGLEPVFVDCGEDLLMDPRDCNHLIGMDSKIEAVMAVHVYGRRSSVASTRGIYTRVKTIEDLAEAHGVQPSIWTDASCWSFYKNKIIAGEEGGAVSFLDPNHAQHAKSLRSLGFTKDHNYEHIPRGNNYRLADCLADKVLNGLYTVGGNRSCRRIYEGWYDEVCPKEWKMPARDAAWVYDIRISGLTYVKQHQIVRELNDDIKIAARCGFKPMTLQTEFRGCEKYGPALMNSHKVAPEVFYLPLTPGTLPRDLIEQAFNLIRRLV